MLVVKTENDNSRITTKEINILEINILERHDQIQVDWFWVDQFVNSILSRVNILYRVGFTLEFSYWLIIQTCSYQCHSHKRPRYIGLSSHDHIAE